METLKDTIDFKAVDDLVITIVHSKAKDMHEYIPFLLKNLREKDLKWLVKAERIAIFIQIQN